MLRTWKEATVELFRPVDCITRYHSFLFLADDGELDLLPMEIDQGQADELVQTYLQKDKGMFYSHKSLMAEVVKLKERSMPRLLARIKAGEYTGIGAGCGAYSSEPNFFPTKIQSVRDVRLFKRMHNTDGVWLEQSKYQKTLDVSEFCAAVQKAVVYTASSIPGQSAKPYWGAREQNIIDQYKKYVPPQFVEDQYRIGETGASGRLNARLVEYIHPQTLQRMDHEAATEAIVSSQCNAIAADAAEGDAMGAERNALEPSKMNYKHAVHGPMIVVACGGEGSTVMAKKGDIKALADKLHLTVAQVKRGLKLLVQSYNLRECGK